MSSNRDFKHRERVNKIAYKLDVPKELINLVINHQADYIKNKISKFDIKSTEELLSEEEFNNKLPVIRLHPVGYFYPNYKKYQHIKNNSKN